MPYSGGTFTILNEIGTGYACNNALVPLLAADLDDIADGISSTSIITNVLTGLIAQSRNSTLINAAITPGSTLQVLQIGPCSLQAGDLLIASAFIGFFNNSSATREVTDLLFISTTQAAVAAAQNSDIIGGDTTTNNSLDLLSDFAASFQAGGTAIVANTGTYYLTYVLTWDAAADANLLCGATVKGIDLVRIRIPLGTI